MAAVGTDGLEWKKIERIWTSGEGWVKGPVRSQAMKTLMSRRG